MTAKRRARGSGQVIERAGGYAYRYTLPDGTRRYQGGFRTKVEATRALNRALGAAADGRVADPTRYTWADITDAARAHYAGIKTGDRAVRRLEMHLRPYLGGKRLHQITYGLLLAVVNALRVDGLAEGTIRLSLAHLKVALGVLAKSGKIVAVPPFPTISVNSARTGFFERSELEDVCEHLPRHVEHVVRFLYYTGWRRGEALSRRWSHVDWDAGTIRLDRGETKNGEPREFPFALVPQLKVLLEEQRLDTEVARLQYGAVPWVFARDGRQVRNFRKAWDRATEAAGCPGRLVHDLRRTAVRNLIRAGVPEKVAMQLTGHLSRDVFDRYNITNEADQRDAARKLALYHEQEAAPVRHC